MSQSSDQQLKQYEREILRARSRVEVADLDISIDKLISALVGKLTKAQHKEYQAARLSSLMGANPESIVLRRALLLHLSPQQIKQLTAPDVMTMEEAAELVVIMQDIEEWLLDCVQAGETSVTFQEMVQVAREQSLLARDRFYELYERYPLVDDIPESLMKVARARNIKQLAERAKVMLPSSEEK